MQNEKVILTPKEIFDEYKAGVDYKASLGDRGIYEQSRMNERFYVGDQWYGAQAGNTRPLVRKNVIKRIGEYKKAVIGAAPISVIYSAEGIPDTTDIVDSKKELKQNMLGGEAQFNEIPDTVEISVIMNALSDYFSTTAERIKLNAKNMVVLDRSYTAGTAFLYAYWDSNILTGLYADEGKTKSINGDIACEVLDVENVNLGDPNTDDIQSQPYIIISQRKTVAEAKREAKTYHQKAEEIKADKAETYHVNSGDRGESEPENSKRVTILTKMWKEYDEKGRFIIKAIRVTENAVVRPEWDLKLHLYPIAKFTWEPRASCAYGDSEVTYLIPNQIAINRALTATTWATMNTGMPKMVVNRDAVKATITNDPGQIIEVDSGERDVTSVIGYVNPPSFAGQLQNFVNDLASGTLSDAGANEAALGTLRPDNASAILQVREAALQPMQRYQNRFYDYCEDVARIFCDFWIAMYGKRSLKITDKSGTYYLPFDSERYENLVIKAKIDVGASTMYSDAIVVSSLGGLLEAGIITPIMYLENIPNGIIPNKSRMIEELKAAQAQQQEAATSQNDMMNQFAQQYPQEYAMFTDLPPEQQQEMMAQIMGGAAQ